MHVMYYQACAVHRSVGVTCTKSKQWTIGNFKLIIKYRITSDPRKGILVGSRVYELKSNKQAKLVHKVFNRKVLFNLSMPDLLFKKEELGGRNNLIASVFPLNDRKQRWRVK